MRYDDTEARRRIAEERLPDQLLQDAEIQGIDEFVEAMDLDTVVAYARLHKIEFDEPDQWLDDEWSAKESWLRTAVMEHMAERIGH